MGSGRRPRPRRAYCARARPVGFLDEDLEPLTAAERGRPEAALEKLLAEMTHDRVAACRICRLCDGAACGHPDHCPVTQAAGAAERQPGARWESVLRHPFPPR